VDEAGWLLSLVIVRAFGGLAFGEVGGCLLLTTAFELAQVLRPSVPRYDPTVVPMTRGAFWARLALPDRHDAQPDGSLVVTGALPHLTWGSIGGSKLAAGDHWWSVTALPPVRDRGRPTYRYLLVPAAAEAGAAPAAPGTRQYQDEVRAEVEREWDDLLFAAPWLVCLLPEEAQRRAYAGRGGVPSARRWTAITAALEVAAGLWAAGGSAGERIAGAFLLVDGGRRLLRLWQGRLAPSLLGTLVSDFLPPERRAYRRHLEAERRLAG
jgi:hypothetical protein